MEKLGNFKETGEYKLLDKVNDVETSHQHLFAAIEHMMEIGPINKLLWESDIKQLPGKRIEIRLKDELVFVFWPAYEEPRLK